LPPQFIPPVPESPLPKEHSYKLQMRCPDCLSDSYPIACFGLKRLSTIEVRHRVVEFAGRLEMPCRVCDGVSSVLVCFFPAKPREHLHG
jgi:hypothetical protein